MARLTDLFDYQKFIGNPKLAAVIGETRGRCAGRALSTQELEYVSAAGDPELFERIDGPEEL